MILRKTALILTVFMSYQVSSQRMQPARATRKMRETHLVGSEYEKSMVAELLNATSMMDVNDDITSLLISPNLTYTLVSSDQPFVFIDRHYFWNKDAFNAYADDGNITDFAYMCVYNATDDDGIFSQIYFPNGDQVREVVFGCEASKECCGMKCCGDDVIINVVIVAAISVVLLFLLLCNVVVGFKKRREKKRNGSTKVVYQTDVTMANDNDIISAEQITYEARHPAPTRATMAFENEHSPAKS